jgi:hypothetical protein
VCGAKKIKNKKIKNKKICGPASKKIGKILRS